MTRSRPSHLRFGAVVSFRGLIVTKPPHVAMASTYNQLLMSRVRFSYTRRQRLELDARCKPE